MSSSTFDALAPDIAPAIRARANQLAELAAAGSREAPYDLAAKKRVLVATLVDRMVFEASLGLDPLDSTLEELMPGLNFRDWFPMELAIRRRAQRLVSENVLFPEGTCGTPDIVTETRAEKLEAELVKRMTYLAELGIDPLTEPWDALLPG